MKKYDLKDIVLCIGYLGEQIRKHFGDGSRWKVHISYSQEKELLGTAGAIKLAQKLIKEENFLVMNGDSFLTVDLNALIKCHLKKRALATIALAKVENPERYGIVEVNNENGKITSFVEKDHAKSKSNLINAGIYVLSKEIFDYIPEGKVSLEKEVFPKLIGRGFYGIPSGGVFVDIGVPEDYKRLQANPQILLELCKECIFGGDNAK